MLEKAFVSSLDSKINQFNPKGNQPWIFIGKTVAEGEAPILWPLIQRVNPLGKTLMLGKIKGKRMRWLDSITDSMDMNLSKLQEIVEDRGAWHAIVYGGAKIQKQLGSGKTTTNWWSFSSLTLTENSLVHYINKYNKLSGLKQQKFIVAHFWRLKDRNQGVGRVPLPHKSTGTLPSLFPVSCGGYQSLAFFGFQLPCQHIKCSPYVSVFTNSYILMNIPLILDWGAHPVPIWTLLNFY